MKERERRLSTEGKEFYNMPPISHKLFTEEYKQPKV